MSDRGRGAGGGKSRGKGRGRGGRGGGNHGSDSSNQGFGRGGGNQGNQGRGGGYQGYQGRGGGYQGNQGRGGDYQGRGGGYQGNQGRGGGYQGNPVWGSQGGGNQSVEGSQGSQGSSNPWTKGGTQYGQSSQGSGNPWTRGGNQSVEGSQGSQSSSNPWTKGGTQSGQSSQGSGNPWTRGGHQSVEGSQGGQDSGNDNTREEIQQGAISKRVGANKENQGVRKKGGNKQPMKTGSTSGNDPGAGIARGSCTVSELESEMESMKFTEDTINNGMIPPDKRSNGQFPGRFGRPTKLEVNHFGVKLHRKEIYQYAIDIEAPWKREYSKKDRNLYEKVFREYVKLSQKLDDIPSAFAFNGKNVFFSTQKILEDIPDVPEIEVLDEDEIPRLFSVKNVKYTVTLQLTEQIQKFCEQGRKAFPRTEIGFPVESIAALDVILQQSIRLYDTKFRTIGRNFFPTKGQVLDLGFGKEVWFGTFTSMRPFGWKEAGYLLTLNADVANKPAIAAAYFTKGEDYYIGAVLGKHVNLEKEMDQRDIRTLEEDLKGMKVRYEMPDGRKRCYRVNGLKDTARKLMIPDLNISVQEYFLKEHSTRLKYPNLPCLWVGSAQKTIYIPMEICYMPSQAMPRHKKLNDTATASMIRKTAVSPQERKRKIMDGLRQSTDFYKNDEFAKHFGISVESSMLEVNGRVLEPPSIQYANKKICTIPKTNPGSWRTREQYMQGKSLQNWVIMDFVNMDENDYKQLISNFFSVGKQVGLNFRSEPMYRQSDKRNFSTDFENLMKQKEKPELVMIILFMKDGELYDHIKTLGDNKFCVPTQCVQKKTLFKKDRTVNRQSIENIFLKMNSKLGGLNHSLAPESRPDTLKRPIMIMGADVSHAAPESKGIKPSLAAVVGSMNPSATQYLTEIRIQEAGQNEEIIQEMEDITLKLLQGFYRYTNRKPDKIIMYRDGVSEGQFLKVLAKELIAMHRACQQLESGYQPLITYIVVQKRHHTRFFPIDDNRYPKNGNVLAGTVVDKGINHPYEGDFYLVSHEGIQGTSRPTHYHTIWDDNNMSADEMEKLTYYLCHLYSRCNRSVSYPAPTYYAHLAADRARKHHNHMLTRKEHNIKQKIESPTTAINLMYFV